MEDKFVPERSQFSVVVVGSFNPAMFQPEWFCKHNIISEEDANIANDQTSSSPLIVSPQITLFKTSQFNVKVELNRFQVVAEKEPLDTLQDFIIKTLSYLGSIDLKAYGFNYLAHYPIKTVEEYQKIGDSLAPKQYWGMLLGDEVTGNERLSGLTSLQMQKVKEDLSGKITITFQPSTQIHQGVFIACNDHHIIENNDLDAEDVIKDIDNQFKDSINYMKDLQLNLLNEVTK